MAVHVEWLEASAVKVAARHAGTDYRLTLSSDEQVIITGPYRDVQALVARIADAVGFDVTVPEGIEQIAQMVEAELGQPWARGHDLRAGRLVSQLLGRPMFADEERIYLDAVDRGLKRAAVIIRALVATPVEPEPVVDAEVMCGRGCYGKTEADPCTCVGEPGVFVAPSETRWRDRAGSLPICAGLTGTDAGVAPCLLLPGHAGPHDATLAPGRHRADEPGTCRVPPPGWFCTRDAGHDGPCAAHTGTWQALHEYATGCGGDA